MVHAEHAKYQQQVADAPSSVERHFLEAVKEVEKLIPIKTADE